MSVPQGSEAAREAGGPAEPRQRFPARIPYEPATPRALGLEGFWCQGPRQHLITQMLPERVQLAPEGPGSEIPDKIF